MRHDAALTASVHERACDHLLAGIRTGQLQEDLCFALWRPATGAQRRTALVFDLIEPVAGDRHLHGNVSFDPRYLTRAVRLACSRNAGLAFMHNHLSGGWQDMSDLDVVAERDRISPPPTVAITFKLPVSTVRAIRAYARRSGLSLGQVVTQAVSAFLDTFRQPRG